MTVSDPHTNCDSARQSFITSDRFNFNEFILDLIENGVL